MDRVCQDKPPEGEIRASKFCIQVSQSQWKFWTKFRKKVFENFVQRLVFKFGKYEVVNHHESRKLLMNQSNQKFYKEGGNKCLLGEGWNFRKQLIQIYFHFNTSISITAINLRPLSSRKLLILFRLFSGNTSYVFLGDYVDRGSFSAECVLYLASLKTLVPKNIILLRGNHESEKLNKNFNFYEEFTQKYSEELFQKCQTMFNSMPLCAVVNAKYFCAHGGISPEAKILSDINKIKRNKEIPQYVPIKNTWVQMLYSTAAPWKIWQKYHLKNIWPLLHVTSEIEQK